MELKNEDKYQNTKKGRPLDTFIRRHVWNVWLQIEIERRVDFKCYLYFC